MKLEYFMTTFEGQKENIASELLSFVPDNGEENELLNVYPEKKYQKLEGFGGAVTDSAGYVFSQMSGEEKKELAERYFDSKSMCYRMVRIPIDSCDFSTSHYEADGDSLDEAFEKFSMKRVEESILPLLDAAEEAFGGRLEIMMTPWSPPSYMKTNGERNNGGSLKEEYYTRWAEYICRYIQEFRSRGYRVTRLSVQNEPKAVQTWDSCVYTAEEEKTFLRDALYPALVRNGLEDVEIFIWDHNKERAYERAKAILDEETAPMVAGIAFHWYSGDHFDALSMIREEFPDKKLVLSEACIEYSKFSKDDYLCNAQKYAHDIIGNLNHGMNGFYDWNLVLDEKGGPNHVGNFCDAPFLYDLKEKKLMKRNTANYLWHFSHFIKEGAVRIGLSNYSDKLEAAAVQNPDGSIAVILLNRTKEEIPVNIRMGEEMVRMSVKAEAIATGVIRK